ncbi:MAG: hypothetical protein ACRD33_00095 [Candidatus Acidiferrales bacterium]
MDNIEKSIHGTSQGAAYRGYGSDGSIFRITRSTSPYGAWVARNEEDADDVYFARTLKELSRKLSELGSVPREIKRPIIKQNPTDFDDCVKGGGRVRTMPLPRNRYMHICYKGGKSHAGEVKQGSKGKFVIFARKGRGPVMHYNGRGKFSSSGPIRVYADWIGANDTREKLMTKYSILRRYKVTIRNIARYAKNPQSRDIQKAGKLLENFSGHAPSEIITVNDKDFTTGLAIGPVLGIAYETVRDGVTEPYFHEFRKRSRPLLAASSDGTQLRIVGGRFRFTESGINDR